MNAEVKENVEAIEKLQELVQQVPIGMLATHDENGLLSSRPMTTVQVDEDGGLWFFTDEESEKVEEQETDHTVYLIYSNPATNTYVHIRGQSSLVRDRQKMRELWKPMLQAWYPEGVNDPKLSLLRVHPIQAKYWNASSNKMVVVFNIVKSMITKERYPGGEVGTLNMPPDRSSIH